MTKQRRQRAEDPRRAQFVPRTGTKDARDTSRHRDDKKRANLARVSARRGTRAHGKASPSSGAKRARVGNASVPAFVRGRLIKDASYSTPPSSSSLARAELRRSPDGRAEVRRELPPLPVDS